MFLGMKWPHRLPRVRPRASGCGGDTLAEWRSFGSLQLPWLWSGWAAQGPLTQGLFPRRTPRV